LRFQDELLARGQKIGRHVVGEILRKDRMGIRADMDDIGDTAIGEQPGPALHRASPGAAAA
jgi:hypothetical protein